MELFMHDILSYLFIIATGMLTWWGWSLFDQLDEFEQKWRYPWLVVMICVIVGLVVFWATV